jgi:Fuc2NAc and GlcNAc transferase
MLLFVTWMLNLYNFMDGIDGLAGGQACSAALGIFILSQRHGNTPLALCALVLSAASLGFLFVNWHPAKVFMGDVGSGFIGYLFALLGLWGVTDRVFPFSSILILLTYFIVDASWTLLRRSVRGERIWDAHRDHAYQHAVRVGCFSHAQVSGAVVGVNFMLLLPAAIACERWPIAQWPLVLVAYACTLVIVMKFRGGVRMP